MDDDGRLFGAAGEECVDDVVDVSSIEFARNETEYEDWKESLFEFARKDADLSSFRRGEEEGEEDIILVAESSRWKGFDYIFLDGQ